jgi:SAM-dependent methyltransferase
MTSFSDHFSAVAGSYATFRPKYPPELIRHLAELAPGRELAWDCGTGNGQAAVLLAEHFEHVQATDASGDQIAHAVPHARVTYRVALADDSGLAPRSTDLVTVAQAVHWFDLGRFYAEVRRVLVPGGLLGVWCYDRAQLDPDIGPLFDWFYSERVGRWWPAERGHVETGYRDLEFPFDEIDAGAWWIVAQLDRGQLLGYVGTWSAVKECRKHEGVDPLVQLEAALAERWPDPTSRREIRWPIAVRVGRNPG